MIKKKKKKKKKKRIKNIIFEVPNTISRFLLDITN